MIDTKHREELEIFLNNLKIVPKKISLYEESLTHRSYSNELNQTISYERMEFFGDSIITKIVSEHLFKLDLNEGQMSKIRIQIVQSKTLVKAAREVGLDKLIKVGKGLLHHISVKIIEDCFEAFIAALYLDQGEKIVKEFLNNYLIKYYKNNDLKQSIDYKTMLQEKLQHYGCKPISYRPVGVVWIRDIKHFNVEVWCDNICYGKGQGLKVKDAEKNAAKDAYSKIVRIDNGDDVEDDLD